MDDKQLELEAQKHIDPEAIKAELIAELELDPEADADKIEKMVAREVKTRTIASEAIGSKIKTRDELEALKNAPKPNNVDADELDKKLDAKLNERLEKRDLEAIDYPDELKAAIKKVAAYNGISVKAALADPYIKAKIDAYEKEQKANDAAVSRTNKGGAGSHKFDINVIPDVDMNTPEGRAAMDAWIARGKKEGY